MSPNTHHHNTGADDLQTHGDRLQRSLGALFENGWQPADVAHFVRRELTQRATRLLVMLIAVHARTTDALHRAPEDWLAQLDDLGVVDPSRSTVVGGYPDTFRRWMRAEKLDADEAFAIAMQVQMLLMHTSRLAVLIAPPSAWGASNRGSFGPASSRDAAGAAPAARREVDAKALKLIRALLAKAEATNFEAEAESFTAKAQEMMTRHSIDSAVLDAAGQAQATGIESRRVHIDNPYADEKADLLSVIADVNGARCVWFPHTGFCTVMGFPVDLRLTDLLFTSLLVQATRAVADATAARRDLRTPSFRRAFLIAYAGRIGERLAGSRADTARLAEQEYGSALLPILAGRQAAVDASYDDAFPDVTTRQVRRLNADGYYAGRAAADRAHLGAGQELAPR